MKQATKSDCKEYDDAVQSGDLEKARTVLQRLSKPLPEMSKRLRGEMEHYVNCAIEDGQLRSDWEAMQMLDEDSIDKDHFSHALRPELRRIKKELGIECFSEKETFGPFWDDEEKPYTLFERQQNERSHTMNKTIQILSKDKRVKSAWIECGNYWVVLADGWYWPDCGDRIHALHESTIKDLLRALKECHYDATDVMA